MECDARNNLGPNDTVLVMWSGLPRLDSYMGNHWKHWHQQYDNFCPTGYEIVSYAYMHAVKNLLKYKKTKFRMMTWSIYDTDDHPGQVYNSVLSNMEYVKFPVNKLKYQLNHQYFQI